MMYCILLIAVQSEQVTLTFFMPLTLSCWTPPSSWTITNLNGPGDSITHKSLTVDSNDVLHMVFYDQVHRDLFYSMCLSLCTSASSWSTTTVDYSNDVGSPNSIGVDSNNGIHVSYFQNNPITILSMPNAFHHVLLNHLGRLLHFSHRVLSVGRTQLLSIRMMIAYILHSPIGQTQV